MTTVIDKIFKDNLPSNSIVQSYRYQIQTCIEEGMWKVWCHLHDIDESVAHTAEFKKFINKPSKN